MRSVEDWPGDDRRNPSRGNSAYLILRGIVESLSAARDRYVQPGARVLDVGGGISPYYPLFASIAGDYARNDIEAREGIRYVSPVEALDIPDASFDLVLCTQVLEHVRHPLRALEEMGRVLAPGGHLFLTTHGVYPFHPDPYDYWRWTQQGFEALFEDTPALELLELVPHGGAGSTMAVLTSSSLREAGKAFHCSWLTRPLIAVVNTLGEGLDRVLPARAKSSLVPNFLAVARKR